MKNLLFTFMLLFVFQSCKEADDNPYPDSACDQKVIVDGNLYKNSDSESFSIQSVLLEGDCLEVKIQSGGCSGETWDVKLVDSGGIAESNPPQRYVKVLLGNKELCEGLISKTVIFDLRPIRTGDNVVLLNLENWDDQIRYEY